MKKHVVIVGAGYAGLRAIEHLAPDDRLSITLFDEHPYHYLQTEAYGYIAGRFDLHDVALDLKNWCHGFKRPVTYIRGKVHFIRSETREVETESGAYAYDYLIIATGARTNFFSFIEGLDRYGLGVKKLYRSHRFRTAFESLLYDKLEQKPSHEPQTHHLAIGGAGLSGVEIAAEMADVIKRQTKSIGESAKELQIYLIDASDTILPGMSGYIIEHTYERLKSLGIRIMTNAFIERVDASTVYFKDGSSLDYTFMIFTGGIIANGIDSDMEAEHNRIGQYLPDETLRLAPDIFAVGDCAELKGHDGNVLPPTAQTAESSAEYAAHAIRQDIAGHGLTPYRGRVDGVFVALGGHYAVGELFGAIRVKGRLAYLLKKWITKSYYLGLRLRLNTGFKKRTASIEADASVDD